MLDSQDPIEMPSGGYSFKSGLIIGLIASAISVAMYFAGLIGESWTPYVSMLVVAVLVFVYQKKFRDTMQGGFIRFGKAYGMGVIMYVVVGVVGAIVNFLMFTLDTSLVDTLLEKQEQKMIDDGMTGDQIEMAMSITESMMSPAMMAVTSVFMALIGGLIISLITSAIVKRNHPMDMA